MTFIKKQFLPLGLIVAAIIGITLPAPGIWMSQMPTALVAVTIIFLISGLVLKTDDIKVALGAWTATLWGCSSILLVTPAIGVCLAMWIPMDGSLKLGLALFCCMPTTLSSGVVLTTQARGNVAMALLLTVMTNIGGVFVVPFVIVIAIGNMTGDSQIELSATNLLFKLCLVVLVPLMVGKALRSRCSGWVDSRRGTLSMISNLALILIPWMEFSYSGKRLMGLDAIDLLLLVVASQAIHGIYLLLNSGVSRVLPIDTATRKAVILMGSQKTLPVALAVLAFLPVAAEVRALAAISCIVFHLGQIIVDAFIATHWANAAGDP
ncbi:MAG: bile acid:sodium symporter [Lentisphaeria bacterium]|jgi:sodium/bile acid cotransporter 7|nr:bile acid:sodium symporter [Lentisphaeria bacterium]